MTAKKRNEFLDADLSDDNPGTDYDSEAVEEAKGSSRQALKRQKLQPSSDDDDDDDDDRAEEGVSDAKDEDNNSSAAHVAPPSTARSPPPTGSPPPPKPLKPLTPAHVAASQRAARKTGVLYLSRIPPFMRPQTVKHLLSRYGDIRKIFLTPEPASSYQRRVSSGGNKKRSFVDGWVEFARKGEAKMCVAGINGRIVGGRKGGWYRDDLWNARYLRGFKWGDLMAQVREEERGREERLRVEVRRGGRERREFLGNLERARVEGTRARRRRRREMMVGEGVEEKGGRGGERRFRQNEVRVRTATGGGREEQPEEVKRVLNKIF